MQCRECRAVLPAEARFCFSCGARVPAPVAPTVDPLLEALDKAIGFQYRIERLLGRGGMGAVYLAHELALDRDVAIKVLPPEGAGTADVRERFKREARTAARLNHPNIVPLYTFGEVSGLMYFVMGYVPGESLGARLKRDGPLDADAVRVLLAAVCDALDYAHRQGVVHRDIKPDNILIDGSGNPLLTDFGIAKSTAADAQLTKTGQSIGTPHYMSPEQALGRADVGPRSDLYSLGVVAYELLAGRRPFEAATPIEALTLRLTNDPPPLAAAAPGVPADIALAVMRCLQRNPEARWPDVRQLREALLPSEEEIDYSPPLRVLQTIATIVLPLTLVALAYVRLATMRYSGFQNADKLTALFVAVVITVAAMLGALVVRLRREGLEFRTIVRKAVQQPAWWRSWYPRPLRRRGDVWDRLPRSMRRVRTVKGVLLTYVWTVLVPMWLLSRFDRTLSSAAAMLMVAGMGGIATMYALRRRAARDIQTRCGATAAEISALLNTPTWRITAWRRRPAASLLRDAATGATTAAALSDPDATTTVAPADSPTRPLS